MTMGWLGVMRVGTAAPPVAAVGCGKLIAGAVAEGAAGETPGVGNGAATTGALVREAGKDGAVRLLASAGSFVIARRSARNISSAWLVVNGAGDTGIGPGFTAGRANSGGPGGGRWATSQVPSESTTMDQRTMRFFTAIEGVGFLRRLTWRRWMRLGRLSWRPWAVWRSPWHL